MSKLDKQGLDTLVDELNKSVNTKINVKINSDDLVSKTEIDNLKDIVHTNKKDLDNEIANLKQHGSNVKEGFATVITSKGVTTDSSDTFETMINNVGSIIVRSPIVDDEIGVVQWEDGSYKGFKEVASLAERLESKLSVNKQYEINQRINIFDIDFNKNVYGVGSTTAEVDRTLIKVQLDGTINWSYVMPHVVKKVIATGNYVYLLGSTSPTIIKLDKNGNLIWSRDLPETSIFDFVVNADDSVFASIGLTNEGKIYRINGATSEIEKTENFGNTNPFSYFLIGIDGTIYNNANNGIFYNFDSNLNLISSKYLSDRFIRIAQDKNRNFYATTANANVVKVDKNYETIWQKGFSGTIYGIFGNEAGYVYLSYRGGILFYSPDGTELANKKATPMRAAVLLQPNVIFAGYEPGSVGSTQLLGFQDNIQVVKAIEIKKEFQTLP